MHQDIGVTTANSENDASPISDIVGALQNIVSAE
jgi:hypothetical protein